MKFAYSIIYVQDVEKTLEFYVKAFGFTAKFITPEKDYAELISGETTLSFASEAIAKSNFEEEFEKSSLDKKMWGVEFAFTSENIDEDFTKCLKEGCVLVKEITEKPWKQRVGYVRDLNGFLIEICTPMS